MNQSCSEKNCAGYVQWRCRLQLIDIGVEDTVHETNAWALVGVLVRKFDMDLPETAFKRSLGKTGKPTVKYVAQSTYSLLGP